MKENFIKTSDSEIANKLVFAGFQLISQDNGIYTFLNQVPKNFIFSEIDNKKIIYTNILSV